MCMDVNASMRIVVNAETAAGAYFLQQRFSLLIHCCRLIDEAQLALGSST
jgi:hypothetical protein